jgi:hypothetical protein
VSKSAVQSLVDLLTVERRIAILQFISSEISTLLTICSSSMANPVTMVRNPGRRLSNIAIPVTRDHSTSNVRRRDELPKPPTPDNEQALYWARVESARQAVFRRSVWSHFEVAEPAPDRMAVESVYVTISMIAGIDQCFDESFASEYDDDNLYHFLVDFLGERWSRFSLRRVLAPGSKDVQFKAWLDDDPHVIRCEEGDERRFMFLLQGEEVEDGDVVIGPNPFLRVVPGARHESLVGQYRNIRLRMGFRVFSHNKWILNWNAVVRELSKNGSKLLIQPQIHPAHMGISISISTHPAHWIKKIAKAVIIFEEYIDQLHAHYSTTIKNSGSLKEDVRGLFAGFRGEVAPPKTRKLQAPMDQYSMENRDMSIRWNRVFRRLTRNQCLDVIDSRMSIWEVVEILNPRKEEGKIGVDPDYKMDFTGLITMGGYIDREPSPADVHNCITFRQSIFTYNSDDMAWMKRLKTFTKEAINTNDCLFPVLARPGNITFSVLGCYGLDIQDSSFVLRAASDTDPLAEAAAAVSEATPVDGAVELSTPAICAPNVAPPVLIRRSTAEEAKMVVRAVRNKVANVFAHIAWK